MAFCTPKDGRQNKDARHREQTYSPWKYQRSAMRRNFPSSVQKRSLRRQRHIIVHLTISKLASSHILAQIAWTKPQKIAQVLVLQELKV